MAVTKWRRAVIRRMTVRMLTFSILSTSAACFCLAGRADLKHEPWLTKDWTQWTSEDIVLVLNSSPWSHPTSHIAFPYCGPAVTYKDTLVQLRSALPVRQAVLRQIQLDKHYDKMDAQRKQEFDQPHESDLTAGADNSVVVVIYNSSVQPEALGTNMNEPEQSCVEIPPDPPTQIALRISGGTVLPPIQINKVNYASTILWESMNQYEYIFPRTLEGKPLYSPSDFYLGITFGAHLIFDKQTGKVDPEGFQGSRSDYTFAISDLMYKGKLEY
jgi:hypothetical protein